VTTPAKATLDVQVETTDLGGGDIELAVTVPAEKVAPIREEVIRGLVRRVNLPGFRRGKAPRALIERQLDQEAVNERITEALLEEAYDEALERVGVKPLGRARIADAGIAEGGAFIFKATLTPRPTVTLGEYKGLHATRHVTRVTDKEVDAEVERLRTRFARFADLPPEAAVEKGDLVIVDYEGYVEGEKHEEASASGYPLEVGADELFPELNEGLVGSRPGETREIAVSYGADHYHPMLAGKRVTFRVTVKEARRRQFPEVDAEFARQAAGLETVEELRARIRETLEAVGRAVAEDDLRSQLTRQACDGATVEVPQAFVGRAVDRRIEEITGELERRDMHLHQHLARLGRSFEDWRADLEVEVREDVRRAIILDEIGTREGIEVTEQDVDQEIHRLAERDGVDEQTVRQRLSESNEFNRLATVLYHRKIVQWLLEHAETAEEVVEPTAEEEPASAPAPPPGDRDEGAAQ
jgi:trigger factor